MNRLSPFAIAVAIVVVLQGCHRTAREEQRPPQYRYTITTTSAGDHRTELQLMVPELIPLGDTVTGYLQKFACRADLCSPRSGPTDWTDWRWSVDRPDRITVYEDPSIIARHPTLVQRVMVDGREQQRSYQNLEEDRPLIARKTGRVVLTVTGDEGTLQKVVQVIPAVATFAWEPNITSARVGDTLRLRAVARDAKGKLIALATGLGTSYRETAARIQDVGQWRADQRSFVIQSAGTIELSARLHKREAVLRINVSAAPPIN